jgi:hypothetical protein
MTTLYARSDLAEVQTAAGRVYKVQKQGDALVVDADPADVPGLLATGSLVEHVYDVPLTFDEIQAAERLEREGNVALQAAARQLARGATDTAKEHAARRRR